MSSKILPLAKSIFVLAVTMLGSSGLSDETQTQHESDQAKQHPGFFDQWLRMKQNDQGVIPTGLYTKWQQMDQEVKTASAIPPPDPFAAVEFLGPADVGGRTRAVLVDRWNNDRIFAGAISGGLWLSEDRGRSFNAIDDAAVSLAVSGIVQSPYDHRTIYYCTGEARANSAGIPGDGVFKSRDGGQSFVQLPSTIDDSRFERCWCVVHSRRAPNTLYVGTERGGLLRSDDGGESWSAVLEQAPVTDAICSSTGQVFAAVSGVGIFASRSGCQGTFRRIDSPVFPDGFQRVEVALCESQPNIIYAAFESPPRQVGVNAFCVSHDAGRTWANRTVPEINKTYNRYCFALAVHPCDPKTVFCAGRFPLYSRDGGLTWRRCQNSHSDYHTVANFTDNVDRFIAGNDGGVYEYRWSNPRATARDLNNGYAVTQFYAGNHAPSGDLVIGGTQDNGTFKLTNATHAMVSGGDGTYCHISIQNPNLAYASTPRGKIFCTADFLAEEPDWTRIVNDPVMNQEGYQFMNPFRINPADGRQLYCRTNRALWRTLDAGENWMRITSGNISDLYAIACSDNADPVVYTGGGEARLYRIDHAASGSFGNERELSETAPEEVIHDYIGSIAIHPADPDTVLVAMFNFVERPRLWRVDDTDTMSPVWSQVSGDLPRLLPVNEAAFDPADPAQSYFAATDFGLYFTRDGGAQWTKEERIPNVSIHQISLRASDRTLFAFTHGRGVWKLVLK